MKHPSIQQQSHADDHSESADPTATGTPADSRASEHPASTPAHGQRHLGSRPRQMRAALAVIAGRAAGALARRLRLGGGTSVPGLVARRLDPGIASYLAAQLDHGSIVVTGTNGKTTTSGLIATTLREAGLRVWRNREGANLMRGVTAALLIRAQPTGRLRRGGNAAAVFEVDEAAFPQVVAEVQPRVIVVTNLFRDQLDRYGEVDTVAEHWRAALADHPSAAMLVLNADDPVVASLAGAGTERTPDALYFGIEDAPTDDTDPASAERVEVLDTRTCPRCHSQLVFAQRYYSHLGQWACVACGYTRPRPVISARAIQPDGLDGVRFTLVTPAGEREVQLALPGMYNVYNALAAAAVGEAVGADLDGTLRALQRFAPAFGRGERIAAEGRDVRLLLAKNPTGLNEVLRTLGSVHVPLHLLLALNDLAADGEDVSWIWDADFERLSEMRIASVTATGLRAYDLALRLKYAGLAASAIEPDLARALTLALEQTPAAATLHVIPTYTAMLGVRGELERRGYVAPYWEQQDV